MFRGTIRYKGSGETWKKIKDLGFLDTEKTHDLREVPSRSFFASLLNTAADNLEREIASRLGIEKDSEFMRKLEWIGLFGKEKLTLEGCRALEVLAHILSEKLKYAPGERDMIVLHHDIVAEFPSTGKRERLQSTMIDYGTVGEATAMARTVSLPAAIASRLILEGRIAPRGVHIPVLKEIYGPVLTELERLGISMKESRAAL